MGHERANGKRLLFSGTVNTYHALSTIRTLTGTLKQKKYSNKHCNLRK